MLFNFFKRFEYDRIVGVGIVNDDGGVVVTSVRLYGAKKKFVPFKSDLPFVRLKKHGGDHRFFCHGASKMATHVIFIDLYIFYERNDFLVLFDHASSFFKKIF